MYLRRKLFIILILLELVFTSYGGEVKYQRILFRLDLSGWSYQELVNFTNEFAGTGGAAFFGVRIYPAKYVQNFFQGDDSAEKLAEKTGATLPPFAVADDSYFPKKWSNNPAGRIPEIKKLEELLKQGKPVFLPLLYHGDEISLRAPTGLYFLNYVVVLKQPSRFNKEKFWGKTSRLEENSYGPYYVTVTPLQSATVAYNPKPREINHDELRKYFESLRKIGAKELIENSE